MAIESPAIDEIPATTDASATKVTDTPHRHSGNSRSPESLLFVAYSPGQLKTLDSVSVKNLDSTPNCNAHGPSSTRPNFFRELFPERRRAALFCRHEEQRFAAALPLPQVADAFFILGPGF